LPHTLIRSPSLHQIQACYLYPCTIPRGGRGGGGGGGGGGGLAHCNLQTQQLTDTATSQPQNQTQTPHSMQQPHAPKPRIQTLIETNIQPSSTACTEINLPSTILENSKLPQTLYNTYVISVRKNLPNSAMKNRTHI
jgi:hypothetical protein